MRKFFTLIISSLLAISAFAENFFGQKDFLPVDEAFQLSLVVSDDGQKSLFYQIAPDYYLYRDKIKVSSAHAQIASLPPSISYDDPFFGTVEIYKGNILIPLTITNEHYDAITVHYQGCTDGLCYPPTTRELNLNTPKSIDTAVNPRMQGTVAPFSPLITTSYTAELAPDSLAQGLNANSFSVWWFLLLGIGLAFTPCVLPMLPLLSAIVIGNNNRPTGKRALMLSLSYVQGMALTYTILGLIVVSLGSQFQIALQSPMVLVMLSIIFTALALSMFGLFDLRLPRWLEQKINHLNQKQQGGSLKNTFIMGMVAGLIASPCTSAPLSGALLYVAQTGDYRIGALALYLLALGMGIPLILATIFGNKILPQSGMWTIRIKQSFGFVMLALPAFLLGRIYPNLEILFFSLLGTAFIIYLVLILSHHKAVFIAIKIALMLLLPVVAFPISNLFLTKDHAQKTTHINFTRIKNLDELQRALDKAQGKKVMFDFYADWCVACKEYEAYTFSDPKVQDALKDYVLLQVDMTRNSDENTALLEHFSILGLPTIIFFDEQGNEIKGARLSGFLQAQPFITWLERH